MHHEGGTRGFSLPPNDVLRASYRMYDQIREGDDYFNPNLSYLHRQPTIADPRDPKREDRILRIMHEFNLIDTTALEFNPIPGDALVGDPVSIQINESQQKKILIISHELSLTGAPLILGDLAKQLKIQGFGVAIISPIHGPLQEELEKHGIEIIINSLILRDAREVIRYLENADLVLANTILSWRAVYSAKSCVKPCIWWVHESQFGLDYIAQYPQSSGAFHAADVLVFPSQQTANIYESNLPGEQVEVIHNGLDTKELDRQESRDLIEIDRESFYCRQCREL